LQLAPRSSHAACATEACPYPAQPFAWAVAAATFPWDSGRVHDLCWRLPAEEQSIQRNS
jgi:hypothetical protein